MQNPLARSLLAALSAIAFTLAITASPPAEAASYVYVSNADSNDIHVFQFDPKTGDLAAVERTPVPGITKAGGSTPIAISPDKKTLYVGMRGEPLVAAAFAIDPASGKLKHLANGPLADSMAYIATDRTGRFLLSASYGGNKVTVNPISPYNAAVQPATQVIATEPNAHMILTDPANRFVLATNLGGDIVQQYRFDAANGTLSPNVPPSVRVKEKGGPRHFVFHPNGKLVFLINELDGAIYVFDYDQGNGTLKQKATASVLPPGFTGKPWAADLHITPDGKYLYGSERTTSTLAAFAVDAATGALKPVGNFATEKQPRGFQIDPSGRYLLAVGQLSDGLSSYAIDQASGRLTKLKEYKVGKNPNWVEIVNLP